ncbi:hypothetical protein PZA11_003856 [Diplocarpon coronariae]|uniref:Uncharacterized protein n=1 Tax=Diplocarpon coronariae TaxID=2795749 RepID=A0A218ZC05_9HELO|nr:hypothetical protein B2J93_5648 [Marssonina coronariae]
MTSSILAKLDGLELPAAADFHVHLRDGAMMETVVPLIRVGGVNTVYVMPNLVPPLTSASDAMAYKNRLQKLDPKVNYLMTLYLHESITPAVVKGAKAQGIVGIKVYPAGVTTNSSSGVSSYEPFYPVFRAMEQCGMVLNLHGECPSDHAKNITILNAESTFLPTLKGLHEMFPKVRPRNFKLGPRPMVLWGKLTGLNPIQLKIVLEHCTTKEAVQAVNDCGPNVVGTITAHHLFLTVDDWADDPFCYCKPVAKWPTDREALIKAALAGTGKFFLGSDSAPHDVKAKKGGNGKTAAGVFTQPYLLPLVFDAFEQAIARNVITEDEVTVDILKGFLGGYGRRFYGPSSEGDNETVIISKGTEVIQESFTGQGVEVVPFRRGQSTWSVKFK